MSANRPVLVSSIVGSTLAFLVMVIYATPPGPYSVSIMFIPPLVDSKCSFAQFWYPSNMTCAMCFCMTGRISRCVPQPGCDPNNGTTTTTPPTIGNAASNNNPGSPPIQIVTGQPGIAGTESSTPSSNSSSSPTSNPSSSTTSKSSQVRRIRSPRTRSLNMKLGVGNIAPFRPPISEIILT